MYIDLNRRFRELIEDPAASGSDQVPLTPSLNGCDWDRLLTHYRVVVLSEAGAGKTAEIRQVTKTLRARGKFAFFLRLENLHQSFDTSFEEGSIEEFDQWLRTSDEGWLLLDSIDEARLRSSRDFELALGTLGVRLKSAMQRTHVVLTGRTAAWRPFSDLALCSRKLPFKEQRNVATGTSGGGASESSRPLLTKGRPDGAEGYKLYALEDLTPLQVRLYAEARKVEDINQLIDELDRSDGWAFTTRPLDLDELLDFWQTHRRIGSRLEFLRASIDRRLKESTEDRAELTPLTPHRAREGVRRIAAACTLMRQQSIAVPDGSQTHRGLQVDVVLADWPAKERSVLLQRAIFDEEIYGTVRFHHRVVREYLTAEWMAEQLKDNVARPSIEALLFRVQYNLLVVNPTTKPILSWLAHLDPRIQEEILRIAPAILLNDGDPSHLPLHIRTGVLATMCADLAAGAPRDYADYAAIQRFAADDLTGEILALLERYNEEEAQNFLLRMVWQGKLTAALGAILAIALSTKTPHHPRIFAIRALDAIGSPADLAQVRSSIAEETGELNRDLVAELLNRAPTTAETLEWLRSCFERMLPPGQFAHDSLSSAMRLFMAGLNPESSALAIAHFCDLLNQEPFVKTERCDIAERYVWLLSPSTLALETLIRARHPSSMEKPAISLLARLPVAQAYNVYNVASNAPDLQFLIQSWPELQFALFWHLVERARAARRRNDRAITDFWQAMIFHSYVKFQPEHFDRAVADIVSHPLPDDKLVALSVALQTFNLGGRLPAQEADLRIACRGQPPQVGQRLEEAFNPPAMTAATRRMQRTNAVAEQRAKKKAAKAAENLEAARKWLRDNLERVRSGNSEDRDPVHELSYLYEQIHSAESNSSTWGASNWQPLISTFGMEIAEAYREGLRRYWRRHRPQLVSEGAAMNSTPRTDILGLGGLYIECSEMEGCVSSFDSDEIDLAFRYAIRELNGFPAWFKTLNQAAPEQVRDLLLREIDFELTLSTAQSRPHYVIDDIAWSAPWSWDSLGPALLDRLQMDRELHDTTLQHLLDIVQGSCASDEELCRVASAKCASPLPSPTLARWFAVWTGVDPERAIAALQVRCDGWSTDGERTKFFMQFLVALIGGRHGHSASGRRAYANAPHLKTLYLLAHLHVRMAEDIDRSGKGVYSPGLRDDAQDARENLLSTLRAQTGKETFMALTDIALNHPNVTQRPYFESFARQVAEADSVGTPWSEAQVRDFQLTLECTPKNHRELFDLSVRSLNALRSDLEQGDSSNALILTGVKKETLVRNYIGGWLRSQARGRYAVPQEEELADAKRPDIRFLGQNFDGPVPVELKLADNWSGPPLFERLENQLCGDYLRDVRSRCGIFLLVYRGEKSGWNLPGNGTTVDFDGLVDALKNQAKSLLLGLANIDDIRVIGIDLTKRNS
ncbi:hypothetical protein RD110_21925 [Rhodoferax koreense]|uniref:Uncharacterized protein n=1 Tax=Rhodoferax koreensis TaxID=1842727 RepID=A0A1P8K0K6_9BURK|nr:hypothetical protein [Rhodoferax koreense]APW39544.1 hypothetical protein RD110_21925 [Rhodoferax koreense]